MINPNQLLGSPLTADYLPEGYTGMFLFARNRPPFSGTVIREMMSDPRVIFGLWLIKGPILANSRFKIVCEDEEVTKYLIENITRFWRNSAARALKSIEWGYSASEVLYKVVEGKIHFDILKDIHSLDTRAVTKEGSLVGFTVRNVPVRSTQVPMQGGEYGEHKKLFIGIPKGFWHIHWRDRHPWYGLSRLYGAHIPWWEQWSDGGYRDIRRLWFHKNAFEGGVMYHPPGVTRTKDNLVISNKDLAREMIEKKRTGGTLTLPNTMSGDGIRSWEYAAPVGNPIPAGLMEYGASLKEELFEGMGIPPEIFQSGGSGFGSATGRAIPEEAFFSVLQEILQWLISDADQQIFRHLVRLNFGQDHARYEIVPFGLTAKAEERENQQREDQRAAEAAEASRLAGTGLPPGAQGQQPTQLSHRFGGNGEAKESPVGPSE